MESLKKNQIVNIIFVLLIFNAIWSIFFSKDVWIGYDAEIQTGWQYQLSKYLYAGVILLMIPAFAKNPRFFNNNIMLCGIIILYVSIAYIRGDKIDFSSVFRFFMLSLSFPFFSYALSSKYNENLLKLLIIAVIVNMTNAILQANILSATSGDEGLRTGHGTAVNFIFILPIVFFVFKDKISAYLFLFGLVLVFISLRRTAILAYLLCAPFIFSRLKRSISFKKMTYFIIVLLIIVAYIVLNYWHIIELRFLDLYQADDNGKYGSGRSDWYMLLFKEYLKHPESWIQGFGPNKVAFFLHKSGYRISMAHNDVLELLLGYGLIGLYLWFLIFSQMIKFSFKKTVSEGDRKLIFMSVLSNIFIALVSGSIYNPNFIVVSIFYGLILNKNKVRLFAKNDIREQIFKYICIKKNSCTLRK